MDFEHLLSLIHESLSKDHLHKGLWPDGVHLNESVGHRLQKIASDFIKEHDIPQEAITDVIITGSMANYNWTNYSDIDLHILVDYKQFEQCEEILSDYYKLAKSQWNDKHSITIFEHEVEIYIQDTDEAHHSTGVYSLKYGEWITKPSRERAGAKPRQEAILRKAKKLMHKISNINITDKNAKNQADSLMKFIKDMRMEGLKQEGEYSLENLVFKHLRNNGYLDKLSSYGVRSYDKQLSIEED